MDDRQKIERAKENVIYQAISGSRSRGLETPDSDTDTKVVFIPSPEWALGIHPPDDPIKDEKN